MRFHLIGLALLASVAIPAAAQRPESVDKRLDRLEQELRAVQRRVFPGANGPVLAPEMEQQPVAAPPVGVPASSAAADINARLDSIEAQLRTLTGQAEQNANRERTIEEGLAELRRTTGSRLDSLEHAAQAAAQAAAAPPPAPPPAAAPVRQASRRGAASRAAEPAPAAADESSSASAATGDAEA
ncbi:MAG TPA: hypothetical protein VFW19_01265, partial [Allosphingosinicella sp.]|nr:hypothetical protein [Allosphingosinicella sp.]